MRRKGWVVYVVVFGFDETKPEDSTPSPDRHRPRPRHWRNAL